MLVIDVVVTADSKLAEPVRAVDGDVRGPGWFLDQLGAATCAMSTEEFLAHTDPAPE